MKIEDFGTTTIHVCPNGCAATFTTCAHVMQDWCVDAEGNFIECVDDAVETTHGPDNGNIWTCDECGETADYIEVQKYVIEVDVFPLGVLYVERKDPNRAYWMAPGGNTTIPLRKEKGAFDVPGVGRVAIK